jgi:hypothetical protein
MFFTVSRMERKKSFLLTIFSPQNRIDDHIPNMGTPFKKMWSNHKNSSSQMTCTNRRIEYQKNWLKWNVLINGFLSKAKKRLFIDDTFTLKRKEGKIPGFQTSGAISIGL